MKNAFRSCQIRAVLAGAAICVALSGARALECPTPQPLGGTAGVPDGLKKQLASSHVLAQIPGILRNLHQAAPAASKQDLVDYLVAAYCPIIKSRPNMSDDLKKGKLKEFANAAIAAEY
jgi:hypothetical protein